MNLNLFLLFLFIKIYESSITKTKDVKSTSSPSLLSNPEPRELMSTLEELTSFTSEVAFSKCDYLILDNLIEREIENKNIAQEFAYSHPKCEWITQSCCTHGEMDKLFENFDKNIKKVKKRFELLKNTFSIFANKRKEIDQILRSMNKQNEMCAETTQKIALNSLQMVIKAAKYKSYTIDGYLKFFIDYQKGFVCGLCDAEQQQYMYIDEKPHFILNGHQCIELFSKHMSFLSVIEAVHQLAILVKSLECTKQNNFNDVISIKEDLFEDEMEVLTECYTNQGSLAFEKDEKCTEACKTLGTFNALKNTKKIFTFMFTARDYYFLYLDPEEDYVPYNKASGDKLTIYLVDTVNGERQFLEDYVVTVDAENGFYPHFNVEFKSNDLDDEGIGRIGVGLVIMLFVWMIN